MAKLVGFFKEPTSTRRLAWSNISVERKKGKKVKIVAK